MKNLCLAVLACLSCQVDMSGVGDIGSSAGGLNGLLSRGQVASSGGGGGSSSGGDSGIAVASGGTSSSGGTSVVTPLASGGTSGVLVGVGSSVGEYKIDDSGACSSVADGSACSGTVFYSGAPSGIRLTGQCKMMRCCMGCLDGSECHYFDNSKCPGDLTGGGSCAACSNSQICVVPPPAGRVPSHMSCL